MKRKFRIEKTDKGSLWIYKKGEHSSKVLIMKWNKKEWHLSLSKNIGTAKYKKLAIETAKSYLRKNKDIKVCSK